MSRLHQSCCSDEPAKAVTSILLNMQQLMSSCPRVRSCITKRSLYMPLCLPQITSTCSTSRMRLRSPVGNIIVKLFVKHILLALLSGKTYVTVLYKQLRYNLLEATPIVALMEIASYTILSTLLRNGCTTSWPCHITGKRNTSCICLVKPKSLLSMFYSPIPLMSLLRVKYLLSPYTN